MCMNSMVLSATYDSANHATFTLINIYFQGVHVLLLRKEWYAKCMNGRDIYISHTLIGFWVQYGPIIQRWWFGCICQSLSWWLHCRSSKRHEKQAGPELVLWIEEKIGSHPDLVLRYPHWLVCRSFGLPKRSPLWFWCCLYFATFEEAKTSKTFWFLCGWLP